MDKLDLERIDIKLNTIVNMLMELLQHVPVEELDREHFKLMIEYFQND
jgi:hypothetical protein